MLPKQCCCIIVTARNVCRQVFTIVTALAILAMVGCSNSGNDDSTSTPPPPSQPPGLLSISGYYYSEPPPANGADLALRLQQVETLLQQAGVNAQFLSYRWSELEPTIGNYDAAKLSEFSYAMTYAQSQGFQQLVGLQIINTVTREVPAELVNTAWDDPAMINALHDLLDQMLPQMRTTVRYLSIGNEVDGYFFAGRESELNAYQLLVDGLKNYVQAQVPTIKVGITVTANGWLGSNVQQVLNLTQNNDVLITTYYPLNSDFTVKPADSPLADFPALVNYTNGRPLVLQEVGYPSAPSLNSSETQQAQFIRNTFTAWRNSNSSITLLNLFLLHDFSTSLVDTFVLYYGVNDPEFRAYLDTLGLRHRDNTDKAAWPAVVQEAADAGF